MFRKFTKGGGANFFAIGNSITLHGMCGYWWNECGMAASEPAKDYFHLVAEELRKRYDNVVSCAFNFFTWEIMTADRDEALSLLDKYLNDNISLITIQLGENANDISTFESDYEHLLEYIKQHCPNAHIIVITDFWENKGRDEMKIRAAEKAGADIADIRPIKGSQDYMCRVGAKVTGKDGKEHTVEHGGAALHPGDRGMKYIADRIIDIISRE